MEFSVMVRDKTKSELKIDLQAAKQADSHGYKQKFGDCKAATLSKAKMGDRLTASGVSTEKVARNGTVDYTVGEAGKRMRLRARIRPAITFIANPHFGELESSSLAKVADAIGELYVGQAIGQLVLSVLNAPHDRQTLTESQLKSILKRQMGRCAAEGCGCELTKYWEADHIEALANGGDNAEGNFQLLCLHCHEEKSSQEKTGRYQLQQKWMSSFHPDMYEMMRNEQTKVWAFVEIVGETPSAEPTNLHAEDLTKCRRNILYHSEHKFPVYCVADYVEPYAGKTITTGKYYVITDNVFPFRGSGWYPNNLVQFGLERDLISADQITDQFLPSLTLPVDFFQPVIDRLLKAFVHDSKLQKLAITALVGMMARCAHKASWAKFSMDRTEAGTWYADEALRFTHTLILPDDTPLYQGTHSREVVHDETGRPIYDQVLTQEAIELFLIADEVKKGGGRVLELKTDEVIYEANEAIPIQGEWGPGVAKYRHSGDPKRLRCESKPGLNRPPAQPTVAKAWNRPFDGGEVVFERLDTMKGLFLDGMAGTGKTMGPSGTNKFAAYLVEQLNKTICKLAPTNAAVVLIMGDTIDKYMSGWTEGTPPNDWVIIDEPSMLTVRHYRFLLRLQLAWPDTGFLIAGDYGQLPAVDPIPDGRGGTITHPGQQKLDEHSQTLMTLCRGNRHTLTKFHRGDLALFEICMRVRAGEHVALPTSPPEEKWAIAYLHTTRMK